MPVALIALALGGFGIGLTEFGIMGLLPEVAADFAVSIPTAGYLISGYALAVAVGAILLTAAVTRLPRKTVLVWLMVLFIAGNLLSAIAPHYAVMMIGRILAALTHGAFFGIGSVVAAALVPPNRKAAAVAIMFTGLTSANVLGVPLGTFLGQALGWRATFWAITIIGIIALIGIRQLVPGTAGRDTAAADLGAELGALKRPQVWWTLAITILGYGGMFGAFTYIAPLVTEVSGFATATVPWLLLIFGIGLFAGNLVGGKAADRHLDGTMLAALIALTAILVGFTFVAGHRIPTIIAIALLGGFGFATVPPLQTRVMKYGGDAPTMASAINIAAFNVGNALGAWLGGLTIAAGLGYTSPLWVGAILAAISIGLLAAAIATKPKEALASADQVPTPVT
ncbi:MFS transporter [Saccharopolyspora phatthalungensis]|uniref:DHA1 family inner membrane transport protein n=1 Tax=Saccharopolyspora phatthalungensis TaxID=664693 RepID=A0A840Q4K1_9PSEU|nr:MFS transporter [Saccharopolyspora phatthalungensis]MBB5153285.1 DHA1 family inner membrane transport protein [Saccharopolyspora phatthalungensis]